jgi:hypothetical protein
MKKSAGEYNEGLHRKQRIHVTSVQAQHIQ